MPDESTFRRVMNHLRTRLLGQEVTLYPSYGYPDPRDPMTWIVPMRAGHFFRVLGGSNNFSRDA